MSFIILLSFMNIKFSIKDLYIQTYRLTILLSYIFKIYINILSFILEITLFLFMLIYLNE